MKGTRREKKEGKKETAMIKKEKGRLWSLLALAPASLERIVDRHGRRRGEISRSELPQVPGARHPRLNLVAAPSTSPPPASTLYHVCLSEETFALRLRLTYLPLYLHLLRYTQDVLRAAPCSDTHHSAFTHTHTPRIYSMSHVQVCVRGAFGQVVVLDTQPRN
jgi:hypothetical protein